MNEFLSTSFAENVRRLALGLETLDAGRGTRVAHPIRVVFHEAINGLPRPSVDRHNSCLHALMYEPGVGDRVDLRFYEAAPPFAAGRPAAYRTDTLRTPDLPASSGGCRAGLSRAVSVFPF